MKEWKEGYNPLRKLVRIVCVGMHMEQKQWGLFLQAVAIHRRDHPFEGQLEE